jgi:hypothetical protein
LVGGGFYWLSLLFKLPLGFAGTFELLAYTDADLEVPLEWEESTARLIPQAASVQMRSWATGVSLFFGHP